MSYRIDRVNEEIKKELSLLIANEIKDYRIRDAIITIVKVDCSRDFNYAKVYISVLGDEKKRDEAAKALNDAKGFLRRGLGQVLKTFHTPELKFIADDTLEYGAKINEILKGLDIKDSGDDNGSNSSN